MRRILTLGLLLGCAARLFAQDSTITIRMGRPAERLQVRQLPRDVAEEIVRFFNSPQTIQFSGATRIPPARGIDGDVAVLGGPVSVAGRISGSLVVVNGDLTLESGAVVGGDVTVVGGTIDGADDAEIAGEIRSYRDPLRYRRFGEEIVYAPQREMRRPRILPARRWSQDNRADIFAAFGGTYNRVEGLPIVFGPRAEIWLTGRTRLQAEAFGIFRTAGNFSLDDEDFGYRARGELIIGGRSENVGLGVRGFDVIDPVTPWPLKNYEAGWAAFLLHRDYRDYYRRRGGALYGTARWGRGMSVTLEGREERHLSVEARDPWTIFRSDQPWPENPAISDGRYRSAVLSARLDTRNDRAQPTSGLLVTGEYEVTRASGVTNPVCVPNTGPQDFCQIDAGQQDGEFDYQRVMFDARAYTRFSPEGRFNVRLAGGGWVGGDALPWQRRFALGRPDPLPGYGIRELRCEGIGAQVAQAGCDRFLFAQAEFRTHLGFEFGPDWADDWGDGEGDYEPLHVSGPDIVVFADAGSAWLVGDGPGLVPEDRLPALRTFKTDIGLGLDFGPIGFYLARALDRSGREVMFSVRMGRRF
jgi:hypothetical protein